MQAAVERQLLAGPDACRRPPGAPLRLVGDERRHDAHAQPRRQPRDVVQRLDDVGRSRERRSRRGSRRSPRSGGRCAGTAGNRGGRRWSRSPRASATGARGRSRGSTAGRSRRRGRPAGPGDRRRRPTQVDASTTRRSVASSRSRTGSDWNSGSPGHQTVTGRSWIRSGATRPNRCRPVSPPAVRKISSVHVSGASGRGITQWAWMRASIHGGPSGSAPWMISVRDGCRPVRRLIVSALRSPTSGWRATTTRFITDVRAAMCRPPGRPPSPSPSASTIARLGSAQMRASSRSMPSIEFALDIQRSVGSPGRGGSASAICPPPAGRVPTAITSPGTRVRSLPSADEPPSPAPSVRSGATGVPRARAGRRPPRAPRCRRRSSGTRGRATRPRCRGSGPRSTTPPRPRRRG